MRLTRGYSTHYNRWYYGLPYEASVDGSIYIRFKTPEKRRTILVDQESLGEDTLVKTRDGKTIYAGDIIQISLPAGGFWGQVTQTKVGVVRYEEDYGGFIVEWAYSRNQHHTMLDCDIAYGAKILGNVYENELSEFSL